MTDSKILVDTNILIYAWDKGDPDKHAKAVELFASFRDRLHLSVQNLSEFAAVMMKHGCNPDWLAETIQLIRETMPVFPLKDSDVLEAVRAVKQYRMHYWDAQIWAIARSNQLSAIFTEDGPIGQTIEGVTYINPLA